MKLLKSNRVLEFEVIVIERLGCDYVFFASLLLVSRNKVNNSF